MAQTTTILQSDREIVMNEGGKESWWSEMCAKYHMAFLMAGTIIVTVIVTSLVWSYLICQKDCPLTL
jgi:hypothetical protein